MKKIFYLVLILSLLFINPVYAVRIEHYPFTVTSDTSNFTTNVQSRWRWLETRVHFDSSVGEAGATISTIFISGDNPGHNTVVDNTYVTSTTDVVAYPGTGDTSHPFFLRAIDELRVVINGTSADAHVTIVGEEA